MPYGGAPLMGIDVELARRETPGCEHVLHFNNAGGSLMPRPVLDAVTGHLQLEARYTEDEIARFVGALARISFA